MKSSRLLLILLTFFAATSATKPSENSNSKGGEAYPGQFPYHAYVQVRTVFETDITCAGCLIAHQWILTSAHCVELMRYAEVFLGSTNISDIKLEVFARRRNVKIHPEYNLWAKYENDIALIKIPHVEFSKFVQPIRLPTLKESKDWDDEVDVVFVGFSNFHTSTPSDILQWITLTTIPNEECSGIRPDLNTAMVCTATPVDASLCMSDFGAALALKEQNVLYGLFSYMQPACNSSYPDVFTRVVNFLKWITKHTGKINNTT